MDHELARVLIVVLAVFILIEVAVMLVVIYRGK